MRWVVPLLTSGFVGGIVAADSVWYTPWTDPVRSAALIGAAVLALGGLALSRQWRAGHTDTLWPWLLATGALCGGALHLSSPHPELPEICLGESTLEGTVQQGARPLKEGRSRSVVAVYRCGPHAIDPVSVRLYADGFAGASGDRVSATSVRFRALHPPDGPYLYDQRRAHTVRGLAGTASAGQLTIRVAGRGPMATVDRWRYRQERAATSVSSNCSMRVCSSAVSSPSR